MPSPADTARDELAARLIDHANYAQALAESVLATDDPPPPGDTLECLRRLRAANVLLVTRYGIRFELTHDADWDTVARALRMDPDTVRSIHEADYDAWIAGDDLPDYPGLPPQVREPASRIPAGPQARAGWLARWRAARSGRARSGART